MYSILLYNKVQILNNKRAISTTIKTILSGKYLSLKHYGKKYSIKGLYLVVYYYLCVVNSAY